MPPRPENKSVWTPHEFKNLNPDRVRQLLSVGLAEMFGTAIVLTMGCMSLLPNGSGVSLDHISVVITFSFAIASSIMIFGHISGCHINPALTIADVVRGTKSIYMFLYYTFMQCFGAFTGYSILRMLTPSDLIGDRTGFCCNAVNPRISVVQAAGIEMFITGVLSLIFCSIQDAKNPDSHTTVALKFGFACTALLVPSAHFGGSSMNPARSFGPALFTGIWKDHWVYWIGPLSGSAISAFIYCYVFNGHPSKAPASDDQDPVKLPLNSKRVENNTPNEEA